MMQNSSRRILNRVVASAISASFIFGLTTPAGAQQSGADSLEEITVTGRKRAEALTDVPVSISVFDAELI